MKKSYLTLAVAAVAFAACSDSEKITSEVGESDVMIGFESFTDKATKGAVSTGTDLTKANGGFGVWGYKSPEALTASEGKVAVNGTGTQKVFDDVMVWYENASTETQGYTYAIPKYWDRNMVYTFFAYAPQTANASIADATGLITIADIPSLQNISKKVEATDSAPLHYAETTDDDVIDYLIAAYVPNQKLGATNQSSKSYDGRDKTVGFTFNHILSQLNVSVKMVQNEGTKYSGVESLEVTKLNITNLPQVNTVKTSFAQNAVTAEAGTYSPSSYSTALNIIAGDNSTVSSSDKIYLLSGGEAKKEDDKVIGVEKNPTITSNDFHYYLAPSTLATNAKHELNFDYTITYVDGTKETLTRTIDLASASDVLETMQQGYIYNITINVDLAQIYFTVDAVNTWLPENAHNTNIDDYTTPLN